MTLYQFNALTTNDQAEIVWNCPHVGERFDEENTIVLYQVDCFYVEVFYNRKNNTITRLRSFASTEQLAPYLKQINIDSLI